MRGQANTFCTRGDTRHSSMCFRSEEGVLFKRHFDLKTAVALTNGECKACHRFQISLEVSLL
jgi:hypothetical protein